MTFVQVMTDRKQYLDLLLLADEQENMIDRYLERGDMFALYEEGRPVGVCVVTDEGDGQFEVKNLAVAPSQHGRGYGRMLLEHAAEHCRAREGKLLLVGTGDSPLTVPFYERCGFTVSHRIPNFFTEHYDEPIFECGLQLIDMVVLKKEL